MDNQATLGITSAILMLSFIIISATATSIFTNFTNNISTDNYDKTIKETIDEISTYIQIKEALGKYYQINEEQYIQKIAILIKPLISCNIDISNLIIKINNGNLVKFFSYSYQADFIKSNTLFEHPIWDNINNSNFGFIMTLDEDKSLFNYNTLNSNTDIAYIIIPLSKELYMNKGDTLEITLIPSTGITKTLTIQAPMPTKKLVSLF